MQTEAMQRVRAERLADYKASPEAVYVTKLDPRADEEDIAFVAAWAITEVKTILGAVGKTSHGATTAEQLADKLDVLAIGKGAKPIPKKTTLHGRIERMLDPMWWRRNLRRELLRENEVIERAAGHVRRKGQCYVSDHAMKRKAARAKVNRATLESLEVCNEEGLALNLQEVADKSVSNPKLRRAELMTRCRGFEETAKFSGHIGLFLTLTCPSRFHKFSRAKDNRKWQGQTTKDAQQYLCDVWKKVRAAWNRAGFFPYGFRVAEPNHEGCVHWHILLFVAPEHAGWFMADRLIAGRKDHGAGVEGIAGRYALADSPGEAGAREHRFTCKRIDPTKGSATGYIAKYISKNIDGMGQDGESVGLDFASGTPAAKGAARVRTWAQVNGIRQFQQIGGPSVTVWRELRKVKTEQANDLFEAPRAAADRGMWSLFWVLQGGPDVQRKDLTLKPLYVADTVGKYGDEVERIWGVQAVDGCGLQTKTHTWTVQRAGRAAADFHCAARIDEIAVERGALAWVKAHGFESVSAFQEIGAAGFPWTRVNNCTESQDFDDAAALKLDEQRGPGRNFQRGGGKPPFGNEFYERSKPPGPGISPDRRHYSQ